MFCLQRRSLPAAVAGLLILLLGLTDPHHLPPLLSSAVLFSRLIVFKAPNIFSQKEKAFLSRCGQNFATQAVLVRKKNKKASGSHFFERGHVTFYLFEVADFLFLKRVRKKLYIYDLYTG